MIRHISPVWPFVGVLPLFTDELFALETKRGEPAGCVLLWPRSRDCRDAGPVHDDRSFALGFSLNSFWRAERALLLANDRIDVQQMESSPRTVDVCRNSCMVFT